MKRSSAGKVKVFFSYSRADESVRDELEKYLAPLKYENLIETWHDRKIEPGTEWEDEIDRRLKEADLILLLISVDFLSSKYAYEKEVRRAIERHQKGGVRVIPIAVRPCDWSSAPFAKFQGLPRDMTPIMRHRDREAAFTEVAEGIHRAVLGLAEERSTFDPAEPEPSWSAPTRRLLPIVLVPGFGGMREEEKQWIYQGFEIGSEYPQKLGFNRRYEGLLSSLLPNYYDATNVISFGSSPMRLEQSIPQELSTLDPGFFSGDRMIINPDMALRLLQAGHDPFCTFWVFRYHDLKDRTFAAFGEALVRFIELARAVLALAIKDEPKVNIIAHSVGGLIVREAVQKTYPRLTGFATAADEAIHKIVTLGTPHKGISSKIINSINWLGIEMDEEELERFNPEPQDDHKNEAAWINFRKRFPLERVLTVVGTDYHSYGSEISPETDNNRGDGLVGHETAQIDGAVRSFIHKCHAGFNSLVTCRETYEIITRFFNGNIRARLRLIEGKIVRGLDFVGRSEFFLGVSIKERRVDFELFHQSEEAENCYGPFRTHDLSDSNDELAVPWADDRRLIWEGYLLGVDLEQQRDLVFRADFYVGERDLFGIGFSDNVVFYKQYYVRGMMEQELELYLYTGEEFQSGSREEDLEARTPMQRHREGWRFSVQGTGFKATFQVELDWVPEDGEPVALEPRHTAAGPVSAQYR